MIFFVIVTHRDNSCTLEVAYTGQTEAVMDLQKKQLALCCLGILRGHQQVCVGVGGGYSWHVNLSSSLYVHRQGPRLPREDCYKQSDEKKPRSSENKLSGDRDYGVSHHSGKHSSSKYYSSSTRKSSSNSSSSQNVKSKPVFENEPSKMKTQLKHSQPSKDGSLTEEQRKKLGKRKLSNEDECPLPKQHSSKAEKKKEVKKSKTSADDHVWESKCQSGLESEARTSNKSAEDQLKLKYQDANESEVIKSETTIKEHITERKCQSGKESESEGKNSAKDLGSELKCQDGKDLEVKKSPEDLISECDKKTSTKCLSKEPSVVIKPPASEVPPNVSHQGGHEVKPEPALHSTIKPKTTSKLAITFKIPKKFNVLQGRTGIWDADTDDKKPSFIGKHPSLVSVKKQSSSSKAANKLNAQRTLKDSSHVTQYSQTSFHSLEEKVLRKRETKQSLSSNAGPKATVQRPPKDPSLVPYYSAPQEPFHSEKDKVLRDRETTEYSTSQPTVQRPSSLDPSSDQLCSTPEEYFLPQADTLINERETKDTVRPSKTTPVVTYVCSFIFTLFI